MTETKPCEHCHQHFPRNQQYSHKQWGEQRFCSRVCNGLAHRQNLLSRFESFFERGDPDSCWEWKGGRHGKGYGQFGNPTRKAHRVAWEMYCGPVSNGLHVLHRCDNPPCVNPKHLFLGTNLDNVRDKIAKGRARNVRGEESPSALLTEQQVRLIRVDPRIHRVIAADYGISQSTVSAVKQLQNWGWLK